MENKAPKTNQTQARFRVARNVMPTSDVTIIPRYDWETPGTQITNAKSVHHIARYESDSVSMVSTGGTFAGNKALRYAKNGVEIPRGITGATISPLGNNSLTGYSQLPQSQRVNDTLYFLNPASGKLQKYDGVQIWDAGMGTPEIFLDGYLQAGTRFIRVVKHGMDFDNNEPVSDFLQFPVRNTPINISTADGTPPGVYVTLPDRTFANTLPPVAYQVPPGGEVNADFRSCFVGTAAYDVPNSELDITETTPFPGQFGVGSYMIVFHNQTQMAAAGYLQGERALSLKVKTSNPLSFDINSSKVLSETREWRTETLGATSSSSIAAIAALITYGANYYLTIWEGQAPTGIYYYRNTVPYLHDILNPAAAAPYVTSITTTGTAIASAGSDGIMFTVSPILNDWFDTNSVKVSPNADFNFGKFNFFSMTKYQTLLLLANEDYIWFSDTTLGGWVEQFNQSNSIYVGDREYGRITSICGNSDFLFVGRERRNYIVTGNISTGNYNVQEVENASVGPWCNSSTFSIKNSVIFISSKGIFQVGSGGTATPLGSAIPENFNSFNNITQDEDIVFSMTGTISNLSYDGTALGMSSAYDSYRDLLVFMQRKPGNPSLVIHTVTGEIYEWDGMDTRTANVRAECIQFIDAKYYLGEINTSQSPYTLNAKYNVESYTASRLYVVANPAKMYSTWLTAAEPSLEKELLQLKLFGKVAVTGNGSLKIKHFKDWNINTAITNSSYIPQTLGAINTQVQFSHKKRLNSDKCLAASVGFEVDNVDTDFEIESFEVEFNLIQSGIKR